ncbi:MAG: formate dehydrogenase accessory sulfurtransferase FdhD [Spirochaetaceae bacterium]|nr:MAG: formate dehydrogenase accessory sulfurtransferase FdhD [Spirochaetaceae bacterium]
MPHTTDRNGSGYRASRHLDFSPSGWSLQEHNLIEEAQVCLYLNGQELVTLMCSPVDLEELAIGFLRSEGLIASMSDIEAFSVAESGSCIDVLLTDVSVAPVGRRVLTSGCGGGVTFTDDETLTRVPDGPPVSATDLTTMMRELIRVEGLRSAARGVHGSALGHDGTLVLIAEDVSRHNCIDRLWGKATRAGLDVAGMVLLTSGRISSEMVMKAARLAVPIVASQRSPTTLACDLAERLGITLCGYVRPPRLRVYTNALRIERATPA